MSRTPERGREVKAAWATPSTHGAAVYETLLYADGQPLVQLPRVVLAIGAYLDGSLRRCWAFCKDW